MARCGCAQGDESGVGQDEGGDESPQQGVGGDHQTAPPKICQRIALASLLTELKTRESHCGRERPGTPKGVLAPESGDKTGSLPATVWIFPRPNCSWFQFRSSGAAIACRAVAIDRDAERTVDRAFWSEGLTGRALWQQRKS